MVKKILSRQVFNGFQRLPFTSKMTIQRVDLQKQFKMDQVVQTDRFVVQQRFRVIFDLCDKSRPALMRKLEVKQILLIQACVLADDDRQQVLNAAFSFLEKLPGTFGFEKTRKGIAFQFSDGTQKGRFLGWKIPDGHALIQVAAKNPEKEWVYQSVEVQVIAGTPNVPQPANQWLGLGSVLFFQHAVAPIR